MIYLLILFLIIILIISYFTTGKDLLSPWVISCCMFLLSALFVIPNIESWNVQLSAITILVIGLGLFSFGFGELFVRKLYQKRLLNRKKTQFLNKHDNNERKPINIHTSILLFFIIFMLIVTYFYYKQVLDFAYAAGFTVSSDLPMLRYARIATTTDIAESVSTNKLLGQAVIISYSYAYLMIYVVLYNTIFLKYRKRLILYAIPIVIYLIQVVLTGGRTQFIYLVSSLFLISVIFYQIKAGWSNSKNSKYIKVGIITFIVMLVVFYFLGTFTGKTSKLNLLETISIYVGSPIVAFDIFLQNYTNGFSIFFGENTLFGIYDILQRFGFDVPNLIRIADFVNIGGYETNIYTSYMRYIKDFSYFGFLIIEMFLGAIYSFLYLNIKIKNKPTIIIVIFAIIFQTIIECSIEERFFMNVLSLGYFLRIGYLVFLYFVLLKVKIKF
ncbi:oligosaccharide repeat unit polymerase [Bacillus infantis]|uniref:O-antigen polymerase n=1 Tax=Bacillus infantis TaxID=324767 RepID=UPI001CD1B9F4|nr:O-antigen polymerase [Bacillus infantis]MCA1033481.1 oligosaccharide repeat unit polymerase [Bacillus infantis]